MHLTHKYETSTKRFYSGTGIYPRAQYEKSDQRQL